MSLFIHSLILGRSFVQLGGEAAGVDIKICLLDFFCAQDVFIYIDCFLEYLYQAFLLYPYLIMFILLYTQKLQGT